MAPYQSDARKWERLTWIDQYSGKQWRGTTLGSTGILIAARPKTYAEVVAEYEYHRESKSESSTEAPRGREALEPLGRRHVSISSLHHIGKESNRLADVLDGWIAERDEVYTEYVESQRATLARLLQLASVRELARRTGLARSTIQRLRSARSRPRRKTCSALNPLGSPEA